MSELIMNAQYEEGYEDGYADAKRELEQAYLKEAPHDIPYKYNTPISTNDDKIKDIGELIRNRRNELGLTQADVARQVGVSRPTYIKWESGNISNMKRSKIAEMAKILKMDPIEFF